MPSIATSTPIASTNPRPSVCPLDCPDTCSLNVTVARGRIERVRGSRANPFTAGSVCSKVAHYYPEFVHGSERLARPLVRIGARGERKFESVSWDEALDRVHEGLSATIERYGSQAVVPFNYAGPHGMLAGGSMDRRFFHRLGASVLDRGPLCGGIRSLAYASLFGDMPGMGPEQAEHARIIVVWSNNVTVSNLHLTRVIAKARRRGAKLVVVDPKRTKIAERADLHIAPRPGTDVVLALALATEFERLGSIDHAFVDAWALGFDEYMTRAREYPADRAADICGVDVDEIRTLARWYGECSPAAISIGNGVERSVTGGACIRAVMALAVLAGKFGETGSGVIAKPGNAFPTTLQALHRTDLIPQGTRALNILDVPGAILDGSYAPPVRSVFIYNHNPVATHPDQRRMRAALSHPDLFVAGCDVAMTDSMAYADVVLPACSHFEIDDIYGAYGQQWLQRAQPVIEPVGEALPNTEIFRRLAARFGFDGPTFEASDLELMDDALDGDDERLDGHRPSELPLGEALHMRKAGEPMVAFRNVFPTTPSGRVELYSGDLNEQYGQGLPSFQEVDTAYPLNLISPSSDRRTNATFGGCEANKVVATIELNPQDAEVRGLVTGMHVRVFNQLGAVELAAIVTDAVRQGVVYSPKGTWLCTSPTGETVNALVVDRRSDIADGACFNNTFVEIEAA
ncbi:MAG: molybdopterin-containing oxidoreductase family protein [Gammaproteobacteria bacterium]